MEAATTLEGNVSSRPVRFSQNDYIQNKMVSLNAVKQYAFRYSAIREIWLNARENDTRTIKETGEKPRKISVEIPDLVYSHYSMDVGNRDGRILSLEGASSDTPIPDSLEGPDYEYGNQEWYSDKPANDTVRIRNYGVSMTPEEARRYLGDGGETSKFDSSDYGGGMGIGTLSPLSVSDSVKFENIHNGVLTTIVIMRDEDDLLSIMDGFEDEETDLEDGMIVTFSLEKPVDAQMLDDLCMMFLLAGPGENVQVHTSQRNLDRFKSYASSVHWVEPELRYGWNYLILNNYSSVVGNYLAHSYLIDGCFYRYTEGIENSNAVTFKRLANGFYNNVVNVFKIHNSAPSALNDRDAIKFSVSREHILSNGNVPSVDDLDDYDLHQKDLMEEAVRSVEEISVNKKTTFHNAFKQVNKKLEKMKNGNNRYLNIVLEENLNIESGLIFPRIDDLTDSEVQDLLTRPQIFSVDFNGSMRQVVRIEHPGTYINKNGESVLASNDVKVSKSQDTGKNFYDLAIIDEGDATLSKNGSRSLEKLQNRIKKLNSVFYSMSREEVCDLEGVSEDAVNVACSLVKHPIYSIDSLMYPFFHSESGYSSDFNAYKMGDDLRVNPIKPVSYKSVGKVINEVRKHGKRVGLIETTSGTKRTDDDFFYYFAFYNGEGSPWDPKFDSYENVNQMDVSVGEFRDIIEKAAEDFDEEDLRVLVVERIPRSGFLRKFLFEEFGYSVYVTMGTNPGTLSACERRISKNWEETYIGSPKEIIDEEEYIDALCDAFENDLNNEELDRDEVPYNYSKDFDFVMCNITEIEVGNFDRYKEVTKLSLAITLKAQAKKNIGTKLDECLFVISSLREDLGDVDEDMQTIFDSLKKIKEEI